MGVDPIEMMERYGGRYGSSRGAAPPGAIGVWADTHFAIAMIRRVTEIVECERPGLMQYGSFLMAKDIDRAFATKTDPTTGAPWAPRKHDYPWPMLERSGNLRRVIDTGWGLNTKSKLPKFFGRVRDGYYVGRPGESLTYTRHSGGQAPIKPNIVVAGSTMYGRSKARGKGTGTKYWYTAPATGSTPGRMFMGFSKQSEKMLAREMERLLKEAASE